MRYVQVRSHVRRIGGRRNSNDNDGSFVGCGLLAAFLVVMAVLIYLMIAYPGLFAFLVFAMFITLIVLIVKLCENTIHRIRARFRPTIVYVPRQVPARPAPPMATPVYNYIPPSEYIPFARNVPANIAPVLDKRYVSNSLRQQVLERDKYACRQCGSCSYLEMDHIIPLSKGGATSYNNLQVLCRGCNSRKGNR